MPEFRIGDKVRIVDDAEYSISVSGSEGIIVSIHHNEVEVKFYKIGNNLDNQFQFIISIYAIELIAPVDIGAAVCSKIKQMEERWKRRNQSFSLT